MTVTSSHEAIEIEASAQRLKDRDSYYTSQEMEAAKKVVQIMIKRFRWRKIVKRAKANDKARAVYMQGRLAVQRQTTAADHDTTLTCSDENERTELSLQGQKLVERETRGPGRAETVTIDGSMRQKPRAASKAKKNPIRASTGLEHGKEHPGRSVGAASHNATFPPTLETSTTPEQVAAGSKTPTPESSPAALTVLDA